MQRLFSLATSFASLSRLQYNCTINCNQCLFSTLQRATVNDRLLTPFSPNVLTNCGFKVKGRVRRRCKSCYLVVRDERVYNICPKFPRHKQMSMKAKPLTTYILTHATQSKIRPW